MHPGLEPLIRMLAFLAVLGSGLVAGIFYAFSTFVMKALDRLPHAQGVAAMQSINVTVLNHWFLAVFVGTGVLSLVAMGAATLRWNEPGMLPLFLGGGLYLAGSFLVTILCNVPRNQVLASLRPDDPRIADAWAGYMTGWTRWNHIRVAASLAACACFVLAIVE